MRKFFSCAALCVAFSNPLHASSAVGVTTLTDYAPFTFGPTGTVSKESIDPGSDSASLEGYSWDVLRAAYHAAGTSIELNVVPWARAVKMLENSQTQILFPATKTAQREAAGYIFADEPIHTIDMTLYVGESSEFSWDGDLDTLAESLDGLSVAVRNGFSYGTWWDENSDQIGARIEPAKSHENNFRKLAAGRVDIVLAYGLVADLFLKENDMADTFKKVGVIDQASEYATAHVSSGSTEAIELFNEGFAEISRNGELDRIRERWGQ